MTNDITRCASCKGRKKFIGLGMIEKSCGECKGIGWTSTEKPITNELPIKTKSVSTKRKYNRKPKQIDIAEVA